MTASVAPERNSEAIVTLTWPKILLVVAFVLVGFGAAILATWLDWPHPGAFLAFGACAWLGSQL